MYTGKKLSYESRAIQPQVANKKRKKNKLDELTLADRFSSVTPTENGEDGLVIY